MENFLKLSRETFVGNSFAFSRNLNKLREEAVESGAGFDAIFGMKEQTRWSVLSGAHSRALEQVDSLWHTPVRDGL